MHRSPPLVPVLSQMNPAHIFPPYFPKIESNIILLSKHRSSARSFPFRFSDQNFVYILISPMRAALSHPSHSPWLNIWWSVQVMELITQSSPASRHFLSLRSKHSQHPVLIHLQSKFFPQWERTSFTLCILPHFFSWYTLVALKRALAYPLLTGSDVTLLLLYCLLWPQKGTILPPPLPILAIPYVYDYVTKTCTKQAEVI
jgi:hypothetical protein